MTRWNQQHLLWLKDYGQMDPQLHSMSLISSDCIIIVRMSGWGRQPLLKENAILKVNIFFLFWCTVLCSLVKAMVFPVVMYGCESCTVKKAEHQKIDAFELWCWRRLLGVPSNQSILKEISPGYCSLEGLTLKLKLQYFGYLMRRVDSLEKTLMLGGIGGRRRRGRQRMRCLDGITNSMDMGVGDGQGGLECCDSWGCKESDTTERLNWTM